MNPLRRRLRRKWRRHEDSTAKELSGRVQPGSGSLKNPFLKEDVLGKHVLCQCKTTDQKGYRLTAKEFKKLHERAMLHVKIAAMRVTIQDQDLAVIRWEDLLGFLQGVFDGE